MYFIQRIFCIWIPISLKKWMGNEAELDLLNNDVDSPHKGPVILSFVIFIVVIMNKLLNKSSSYHWYETA